MPTELVQRINLDLIYPPFLERILDGLAEARNKGSLYYATLGFRTFAEQDALYAKGRGAPGPSVTNAHGGQSAHNFGLAIDFCHDADPNKPGLQMDWRLPEYKLLGEVMEARGLVWGGTWATRPDSPHVQWAGYVHAKELAPLLPTMTDPKISDLGTRLHNTWALVTS